jgi:hypothetical protein
MDAPCEYLKGLKAELNTTRADAALVVHALNCAIQLTEALIAYMPDNSPLHPSVASAKGALDAAMKAIHGRLRNPPSEE